ncbi:MAG: hypothetical protein GX595_02570 [Lentisphaerae bacterium]|nr:hypothetical protein [Lentisphaerota bacterium]
MNAFHNPYPESFAFDGEAAAPADRFERTVVVVAIDAERFYVVDHFQVRGGHQHDQSWHALPVEPEVPALDWAVQATGTLAGPDVKEFDAYTDRWGRRHEDGGFASFVTQVRRAPLRGPAVWTWRSGLPEGDAVALHVVPLGGPAEVVMGKGRSPVWAEDRKLDYLFVRRQPPAGGPSQFLTVLDPYQGQPQIRAVEVVAEDPLTIAVHRDGGTDRVVLHIPDSASRTTAHRPVGVAVQSAGRDVRIGGADPGYVSAVIAATDHAAQQVTVPYSEACAAALRPGRYVRIFNDQASSMWRLGGVERDGDRLRLTFRETALVAELPIEMVTEDGRLALGVRTPFVRGRHAGGGATLTDPPNDFYHGVWLGEGAAARLVAGITQTQPPYLHLVDRADVDAIRRDCAGKVVRLWRYAVGDRIEAACLSYAN